MCTASPVKILHAVMECFLTTGMHQGGLSGTKSLIANTMKYSKPMLVGPKFQELQYNKTCTPKGWEPLQTLAISKWVKWVKKAWEYF